MSLNKEDKFSQSRKRSRYLQIFTIAIRRNSAKNFQSIIDEQQRNYRKVKCVDSVHKLNIMSYLIGHRQFINFCFHYNSFFFYVYETT